MRDGSQCSDSPTGDPLHGPRLLNSRFRCVVMGWHGQYDLVARDELLPGIGKGNAILPSCRLGKRTQEGEHREYILKENNQCGSPSQEDDMGSNRYKASYPEVKTRDAILLSAIPSERASTEKECQRQATQSRVAASVDFWCNLINSAYRQNCNKVTKKLNIEACSLHRQKRITTCNRNEGRKPYHYFLVNFTQIKYSMI